MRVVTIQNDGLVYDLIAKLKKEQIIVSIGKVVNFEVPLFICLEGLPCVVVIDVYALDRFTGFCIGDVA